MVVFLWLPLILGEGLQRKVQLADTGCVFQVVVAPDRIIELRCSQLLGTVFMDA